MFLRFLTLFLSLSVAAINPSAAPRRPSLPPSRAEELARDAETVFRNFEERFKTIAANDLKEHWESSVEESQKEKFVDVLKEYYNLHDGLHRGEVFFLEPIENWDPSEIEEEIAKARKHLNHYYLVADPSSDRPSSAQNMFAYGMNSAEREKYLAQGKIPEEMAIELSSAWTAHIEKAQLLEKSFPAAFRLFIAGRDTDPSIPSLCHVFDTLKAQAQADVQKRLDLYKQLLLIDPKDPLSLINEANLDPLNLDLSELGGLVEATKKDKRCATIKAFIEGSKNIDKEKKAAFFNAVNTRWSPILTTFTKDTPWCEVTTRHLNLVEEVVEEQNLQEDVKIAEFNDFVDQVSYFFKDTFFWDIAQCTRIGNDTEMSLDECKRYQDAFDAFFTLMKKAIIEKDFNFQESLKEKLETAIKDLLTKEDKRKQTEGDSFKPLSIQEVIQKIEPVAQSFFVEYNRKNPTPPQKTPQPDNKSLNIPSWIGNHPMLCGTIAATTVIASTFGYAWSCFKNEAPKDEDGNPVSFKQYVLKKIQERGAFFWLLVGSCSLFGGGGLWSLYNYVTAPAVGTK